MQYRGRIEFTIDNVDKVKQDIDFSDTRDLTDFINNMASYFSYHNKNLNAVQYDFIKNFISIVDNACCYYDDSFDRFQNDNGTPITTK